MKNNPVADASRHTGLNPSIAPLALLLKSVRRYGMSILLFSTLTFSGAANLAAQTAAPSPAQPSPSPRLEETAPPPVEESALVIQNRTITVFRSRFQGRSPRVRMESAQRQFQVATNSPRPGAVSAQTIAQGLLLSIGEESIFVITPEDLDQVSDETMDEAGNRALNNLRVAYAEALELRDGRRIATAVGLTVLATLLLLLSFWALRRLKKIEQLHLSRVARTHIRSMGIGGFTILNQKSCDWDTRHRTRALFIRVFASSSVPISCILV